MDKPIYAYKSILDSDEYKSGFSVYKNSDLGHEIAVFFNYVSCTSHYKTEVVSVGLVGGHASPQSSPVTDW
jgi:hypothetical protein